MSKRGLGTILVIVFFSLGICFTGEAVGGQKIQYGTSKSGKKYYRYCSSEGCTEWKPVRIFF